MLNLLTELGAHDFWLFLVLCPCGALKRPVPTRIGGWLLLLSAHYFAIELWYLNDHPPFRYSQTTIMLQMSHNTSEGTMFFFFLSLLLLKSISRRRTWVSKAYLLGNKRNLVFLKTVLKLMDLSASVRPSVPSVVHRGEIVCIFGTSQTASTDFKSRLCYVFQLWPFQLSITTTLAIVLNIE